MNGRWFVAFLLVLKFDSRGVQALEDGEDIDELQDRGRKERRAANKLLEDEARGSLLPGAGLKSKKGKGKAGTDTDSILSGKRKRIGESSVTPSLNGEEDDEHDSVREILSRYLLSLLMITAEAKKEN